MLVPGKRAKKKLLCIMLVRDPGEEALLISHPNPTQISPVSHDFLPAAG
jgi:hypothetical protein